jgi:hypothetical protein
LAVNRNAAARVKDELEPLFGLKSYRQITMYYLTSTLSRD